MKPDMRETSERLATQARCQAAEEQRGKAQRKAEEHVAACRAVQFRTRLSLLERRLFQLRAILRYQPQDEQLRAEAEQLEGLYRQMLEGNAP